MDVVRLTRVSSGVLMSLALAVACSRSDPPASTTTSPPIQLAETDAWAMVRSAHPRVPIIVPTWMPPSIDRSRVEVRGIGFGSAPASEPLYTVAYLAPSGATILFALGPESDVPGSGIGTRVRNTHAVLSFSTSLFADPTKPAPRRVRWKEGPHVLRIESDRFTGEDLLHIAWALDRTGAPVTKNPYTRTKPGACAARGGVPEDTVRRLLGIVGAGDRDAVMDCFSLELLGEYPEYGAWAHLPRVSDIKVSPPSSIGGRFVVGASWRFATDPGGAWSQQPHHFFTVGEEDGSWRIYETATATSGPPP